MISSCKARKAERETKTKREVQCIDDDGGARHRRITKERGELHSLDALVVPRKSSSGAPHQKLRDSRIPSLHVATDLPALPSIGLRSFQPFHRSREHRKDFLLTSTSLSLYSLSIIIFFFKNRFFS